MNKQPDPSHIMQTATAFWASKVLLTGVEFGLFSTLGEESMTAMQIGERLGIHPRGRFDFLDALVALNFLDREGDGPEGLYRNTLETNAFLNKTSPTYIGGLPEMLNKRLFGFWNDLGTALRTGEAQTEVKVHGKPIFEELYASESALKTFLEAMTGFQHANFVQLGEKFDFSRFNSVTDVGGALALLSRTVGSQHKHLVFKSFDLPPVAPLAQKQIDAAEMTDRITVVAGDFFQGELPKADVITMGNILHDWNLEQKKLLIQKAYDALPEGGAFIAVENLIDDARRENAFGLLMSLNMLIEFGDAFDYTAADFRVWCIEAGFSDFDVIPLAGPTSAAIAYK
jgi:hypothetical protein